MLRVFFGVTKMALGWEVSLSLWLQFTARFQAGGNLDSAVTGIWRSCIRCLSALTTSVETKQEPREPSLIAFLISLPAMLWRSVTIFLMLGCWRPERMWSSLSWQEQMGQLMLLDFLKRTACFRFWYRSCQTSIWSLSLFPCERCQT